MKKIIITVFILTLSGAMNKALAGPNTEVVIVNNEKNQDGISEGKESNKYTFTLFSFFTRNNEDSKTDSVNTNSKALKPKLKLSLN